MECVEGKWKGRRKNSYYRRSSDSRYAMDGYTTIRLGGLVKDLVIEF